MYGNDNPVQRCRNHKIRNVLSYLPKDEHDQVRAAMRAAFKLDSDDGQRKLEQLASWLERENPSAAGSLREGLRELVHQLAEFPARSLFDIEHVEIKGGLVRSGQLPRSRFFLYPDPLKRRDIVVFIGEAQPPSGKFAFCHRLVEVAQEFGVQRVFTFAAMATDMNPSDDPHSFGVATDQQGLEELKRLEIQIMDDGHIGGLNGVLLAAAAERELPGIGLLGEMPAFAPQIPFPKASRVVLDAFTTLAGLDVDFTELDEYGRAMESRLTDLLQQMQEALRDQIERSGEPGEESFGEIRFVPGEEEEEEEEEASASKNPRPSEEDRKRIDALFEQAARDRSKAFELKKELDRLDVFKEYEDRFLDLFKQG